MFVIWQRLKEGFWCNLYHPERDVGLFRLEKICVSPVPIFCVNAIFYLFIVRNKEKIPYVLGYYFYFLSPLPKKAFSRGDAYQRNYDKGFW